MYLVYVFMYALIHFVGFFYLTDLDSMFMATTG